MKRFKRILVVAGGSQTGLVVDRAVELARLNDAVVTLLDVQEAAPTARRASGFDGQTDLDSVLVESRTEQLSDLTRTTPNIRVDVVLSGEPAFIEVVRRVIQHDHDLVMVPADLDGSDTGRGGRATTMHLLRKCPVPVMVVRPDSPRDVAVAVGPFDDESRVSLDETLLELGSSLAAMQGGVLHVVHAWRLIGESLFRSARRGPSKEVIDEMVASTQRQASEDVTRLLERANLSSGVDVSVVLRQGMAGEIVPAVVEELRAGVLVMGTLARTGIGGLIIGNTAERVLDSVHCSVLAVKPAGFVSPVQVLTSTSGGAHA